ncbi:MAG: nucleotidyltransferase family protein [Noviherbaspirillum sp.]
MNRHLPQAPSGDPEAERYAGRMTGILLAAGKGSRFDPAGLQNKLLQVLPGGACVAAAAAANLAAALPAVLAVVRPGADALAARLREAGCEVTVCPDAEQGMGASLVHALQCTRGANGWVVALADMPYVRPDTVAALAAAIAGGAGVAQPVHGGKRGNPVAFGRQHLSALLRLGGDQGARALLKAVPVAEVEVGDPGILRDIDTPADLAAPAPAGNRGA